MPEETEGPDPTKSLLAFLGVELRRLRKAAGLTQAEVAKMALSTQAMISYVEAGKRILSFDLAKGLDGAFDTDFFTRFHPLVVAHAYPAWFLPYVELEGEATSIRAFMGQAIPGLLQTEEYARAIIDSSRPDDPDGLVAARMSRQVIFERERPPRTWFVLDEDALRRPIAPPDVMRGQYAHLLKAGSNPRTVIQVVPAHVGRHAGLAGAFTILSFEEGPDVLHVDAFYKGRMGSDEREMAHAKHAYDLLKADALSPKESAELIGSYLKGPTP